MVIEKGWLGWRAAAAAAGVVVSFAVGALVGQERTPQERMSGAWQLDAAASSPLWSTTVAEGAAEGRRKGSGGKGSQADNEPLPVGMRTASSSVTSASAVGATAAGGDSTAPGRRSTISSTSVFHSPQAGQRPAHLGDWWPHCWQT